MKRPVRMIATGVYIDRYPDPEEALAQNASTFGRHLSPDDRGDIARWRAGEVAYVRLTPFAEFDDSSGHQRWEGTPQGPCAVPLTQPATSTLLELVEMLPNDLLAELGVDHAHVSRFAFRAAPHRIDIDPGLARVLVLD